MKIRRAVLVLCFLVSVGLHEIVLAQSNSQISMKDMRGGECPDVQRAAVLSATIVGVWEVIKCDGDNRISNGRATFGTDGTFADALSLFGAASEWKAQGDTLLLKRATGSGKDEETYRVVMLDRERVNLTKGHDTYFLHKTGEIPGKSDNVANPARIISEVTFSVRDQTVAR